MKKTDSTLSHPLLRVGKAIKQFSFVVPLLALFFTLGMQQSFAQSPTDLGEELTEEVKIEFESEINYLDEQTDKEELPEYLEQVLHSFDQGSGLGTAFRTHAGNVLDVPDDVDMTQDPNTTFKTSQGSNDELEEFYQLTQNIELSIGDMSDLHAIFQFLRNQ